MVSGVNFINVFARSFYARRFQKQKKLLEQTVFFALLGSACVKAAHKMLVKLTPRLFSTFSILLQKQERGKVRKLKKKLFVLQSVSRVWAQLWKKLRIAYFLVTFDQFGSTLLFHTVSLSKMLFVPNMDLNLKKVVSCLFLSPF